MMITKVVLLTFSTIFYVSKCGENSSRLSQWNHEPKLYDQGGGGGAHKSDCRLLLYSQ